MQYRIRNGTQCITGFVTADIKDLDDILVLKNKITWFCLTCHQKFRVETHIGLLQKAKKMPSDAAWLTYIVMCLNSVSQQNWLVTTASTNIPANTILRVTTLMRK